MIIPVKNGAFDVVILSTVVLALHPPVIVIAVLALVLHLLAVPPNLTVSTPAIIKFIPDLVP